MSFREFLEKGIKCGTFGDTPDRDFAADFLADKKTAARDFQNADELEAYLLVAGACPEAVQAGARVFRKWKSKPKRANK